MHAINYANHEIANILDVYDNVKVLLLVRKFLVMNESWT